MNIFKQFIHRHSEFSYDRIGDIDGARGTLGNRVPVKVYRIMKYTLIEELLHKVGEVKTRYFLGEAGRLAGMELGRHRLPEKAEPAAFFDALGRVLAELQYGRLDSWSYDAATGVAALALANPLEANAPERMGALSRRFEAGLFAGILEAYTGGEYLVNIKERGGPGGVVWGINAEPV